MASEDYCCVLPNVTISLCFQMPELESLFEKTLKSSSYVIACRFPLPNWKPSSIIGEGIDTVWVYEVK